MAWTTPHTWAANELVTAALMNTHLRDNLNATSAALVTTAGDIVYATGANALTRLGVGASGTLLRSNGTAPFWGTLPESASRAIGSALGRASTTTVSNDPDILFAMAVSRGWAFVANLLVADGVGSGNFKFTFTVPTGATIVWSVLGKNAAGTLTQQDAVASGTTANLLVSSSFGTLYQVFGYVTTDGTHSGNLQLQWAQNSSNVNNVYLSGSLLRYELV